jgi:hypothetical protein
MKNILTIVFLLFAFNALCQSNEWTQLASPDKTFMENLYLTSKGNLLGREFYSKEIQYKNKLENKWHDVALFNFYRGGFNEDREGNLYFSNDIFMYKFDEDSLKFTKIFNLTGLYPYINNFIVLDNGDFLLNSSSSFMRYTKQGVLKNAKTFSLNYLIKKDGDAIFMHTGSSPDRLLRIDTLFNVLDSVEFLNPLLLISNQRLFGTEGYSDDIGRTWKQYPINNPFDYIYDVSKGHDGTIFLSTYNQIYFSIDNGDTYKAIQVFGPNGAISSGIKYISSSENHEIVALVNRDGCAGTMYWSPDNGKNWQTIPINDGTSWSKSVCVKDEKEYYVRNQCNYRSKNASTGKWEDLTFKNEGLDVFPTSLEYDEEGYLFAKGANASYVKSPNQSDWTKIKGAIWTTAIDNAMLLERKDILYNNISPVIQFSNDHGNTWQSSATKWIYGEICFTHSKLAYRYFGGNTINLIDLVTNQSEIFDLPLNFRLSDFTVKHSTDELYIVGDKESKEIVVYFTKDKGLHWTEASINNKVIAFWNILSDYNNNIFIYSEQSLFYLKNGTEEIQNITPDNPLLKKINDVEIGLDGHLYIATDGLGVLKYEGVLSNTTNASIDNQLMAYPNPASDRLFIKNAKSGQKIVVYDSMGKPITLLEGSDQEQAVDISVWKKGLYFIVSDAQHSSFVKW